MPLSEYVERRNSYAYPAVGLSGTLDCLREACFETTRQLDSHQNGLLTSSNDEECVLGYLSTIFWGRYSGKNRRERPGWAQDKVRRALTAIRKQEFPLVAHTIRSALAELKAGQYAEALQWLGYLPQLGIPFASKVCTFLIPEKCGVIDSVMAERYPRFGFSLTNSGYVKDTPDNRRLYGNYCAFLQNEAEALNRLGEEFEWVDRDGIRCPWRAVDIERALYQ